MIQLVHIRIYSSPLDHHLCSEKQKNDDIIWIWTMFCIVARTLILLIIAYSLHHPKDTKEPNSSWQKHKIQHLALPFCDPFPSFLMLWDLQSCSHNCNPPHKTKTGTTNRWGELLVIANHLDESLWWANQKHWTAVRSLFITLFSAGANCANYSEPKPFSWTKLTYFDFFFIQFLCCRITY